MTAKHQGNYSGDFCCNITTQGNGETATRQKVDHLKNFKMNDFEHIRNKNAFVDANFDSAISRDLKLPQRILNQRPPRTPQQIAQDLQHKLREGSIRRSNHLDNISQKCRLQNEKVIKVREKLVARHIENALMIEKELLKKEESAEQIRVKFIDERVKKFRKQVRHAEEIKNKKMAGQCCMMIEKPEKQHSGT